MFLGGVPWDLTEPALRVSFSQFGDIHVEWPGGRDGGANPPKGYVYIVFGDERQVKHLLSACFIGDDSNYYFKLSATRRMRIKEVQIIPWLRSDGNFVAGPSY